MGFETILATTAITSTVLGTGLDYWGKKKSGKESKATYEYNSALSDYNAQVSEQEAELVRRRGVEDKRILTQDYAQLKGLQEVGYSKSGVRFEGTPAQVMLNSARNYEHDLLKTDYNARIGMGKATSQAEYYRTESEYKRWLGKQSQRRYETSAGLTLLKGGARLFPYMI